MFADSINVANNGMVFPYTNVDNSGGAHAATAAVVRGVPLPLTLLRPALDPSRKTVADIISLEHGDARARFQAVVGAIAARYASNPSCVVAWLAGVRV